MNRSVRVEDMSADEKRALLAQLLAEQGAQPWTAPLSSAQERLWFLHQLDPQSPAYNISQAARLTGELDTIALHKSLETLVARHESLRTVFTEEAGRPMQVIGDRVSLDLPVEDLSAVPSDEREMVLTRRMREESRNPFDLRNGPLVRARLLRLAPREHVLLLMIHHVVADGWSMGILNRELAVCYEAFTRGRLPSLPELPIQYADFAQWQREQAASEDVAAQCEYWKQQLKGAPPHIELPTDRPRPPAQTDHGWRFELHIPSALTESLRRLSRQEGATTFMAVLAALGVLLHRYCSQDQVVIGSPTAGRPRAEAEGLVGFFVNTLALRIDLSGNPTFRGLLQRVKEVAIGAFSNQDVPFERLVRELQPQRDPSRAPLFGVMLAMESGPKMDRTLAGLQVAPIALDLHTAKFDLTFNLNELEQGLTGSLEYNTDLFDAATIERMVEHLRVLLDGITANPDACIEELPLLPPAERDRLLLEWNRTDVLFSGEQCLHSLFEGQAARTPERVAVVFGGRELTYDQLNRRADNLAQHLRSLSVGPDVLVGIFMDRSLEMVVALLGMLKAGGAYVPLDPGYPADRVAFMLADSCAAVVISQPHLAQKMPAHNARVVLLDTEGGLAAGPQGQVMPSRSAVTPDHLAYVIYTSGTTGRPKGAMISHRAICNHMLWMREQFPLAETDSVLQKTSLSFDASVWEFYAPLLSGSRLVMAEPDAHRSGAGLVQAITQHEITTIQIVPSLLELLLEDPGISRCGCLRRVFCGGEVLTTQLQDRFFAHLDADLYNLYGPTETTIDATFWKCERDNKSRTVPTGRPISNTRTYILDRSLQPVPIGVAGELHIGGAGLARGYLNQPELTAQKFIADPFSKQPHAKLYKTGDLARFRADGNVEYLGRLDHQVKVRGYRIELGEIEAVLALHPGVRQAAAVVRSNARGEQQLVAYVAASTPPGRDALSIHNLRQHLRDVPEPMVPSAFVILAELPRLPNGKVDRASLPEPQLDVDAQTAIAPRNAAEAALAAIWCEVLGVVSVGVTDNFFDLGGHSLLAMRIVARIKSVLNVELPLPRMFDSPSIAELAAAIERVGTVTPTGSVGPITRVSRTQHTVRRSADGRLDRSTEGTEP